MDDLNLLRKAIESNNLQTTTDILSSCALHQNILHNMLRKIIVNQQYQICEVLLNYGACPFFDYLMGYGGTTAFELAVLTEDYRMIRLFANYSSRWDVYIVRQILNRIHKKTPKSLQVVIEILQQQQVNTEFFENYINKDFDKVIEDIQKVTI